MTAGIGVSDFPLDAAALTAHVAAALDEDVGTGDVTTLACIPESATMTAVMQAREPVVLAGLPYAVAVFQALDPALDIVPLAKDGDRVDAGAAILRISGAARAILTGERTALNMLQHLSGIATLTRTYSEALIGTKCKLLDTRKTLPGYRRLAKYATALGGAQNHRMGLFDAVMIKDNHIAAAGGVRAAVTAAKAASDLKVQVECDTLEQVDEALAAGAHSLLLDNMRLRDLRAAVATTAGRIPLEASGGINRATIRDVAETGVDYISVGRITQSAPAVDIGLDYGAD